MKHLQRRQSRAQRGIPGPLATSRHLGLLMRQRLVEDEASAAHPASQHGLTPRLQAQCKSEALADRHGRDWRLVAGCMHIQHIEQQARPL